MKLITGEVLRRAGPSAERILTEPRDTPEGLTSSVAMTGSPSKLLSPGQDAVASRLPTPDGRGSPDAFPANTESVCRLSCCAGSAAKQPPPVLAVPSHPQTLVITVEEEAPPVVLVRKLADGGRRRPKTGLP